MGLKLEESWQDFDTDGPDDIEHTVTFRTSSVTDTAIIIRQKKGSKEFELIKMELSTMKQIAELVMNRYWDEHPFTKYQITEKPG
jgi:hypothetical protein